MVKGQVMAMVTVMVRGMAKGWQHQGLHPRL
jgi:hypothetical protein